MRVNERLRFRNRFHEIRLSEVIKTIDSTRNLKELMENKCGEQWVCVDAKARDSLAKDKSRTAKFSAGMSMCGGRIKLIDKNNKNTDFPIHNAE